MTKLPPDMSRYTGDGCDSAIDAQGKVFFAFQKQNDLGCCVVVEGGVAREIPLIPQPVGRVRLDCDPARGLWLVGNKETGTGETPPRYPIAEYTPFPAGTAAQTAQLQTTVGALAARVKVLEQRPVGVSSAQAEEIAWGKANDALYAQTRDMNSPLAAFVWQKAKEAAWALLRETGLIK